MRFFIELSYNGKYYHGWQAQPNTKTVQAELNKALSTILNDSITVVGAGRTDAGVHAKEMFAHFDTQIALLALGYPHSTSNSTACKDLLDIHIDKKNQFIDWRW